MIINGKEMNLPGGLTIIELLEKLNLHKDRVVVEVNYEIVAKEQYVETILNAGDQVEIVSFVGGG
ncbi:thiamine biosynthesis protein ThiS [Clostridium aceticum]|uniref:Thiamine biosynthesis protein ThiS n=1 Tax=Clostridium aceticum TaxID=84022 RepID=A0A0D8I832_9CLOT|nr:sulfur carrier protein ThiS [Clostridium aceticum]AKL97204.1 thiamine biosynthesis protein ThiS [Clostridium aceticum]KJF26239.1 thiamine biosynthesis protein ThiS [Clostridium aceticum]